VNIVGLNSGAIILLSLRLAFVFSDIFNVHNRTKTAVLQEADALRTLGRTTLNIDPSIGIPLMKATREYTEAVLQKEWPELKAGRSEAIRNGNQSALQPLTVMSDLVYSPDTSTKVPNATSMQLGLLVSRIREQRLLRVDTRNFSIGLRGLLLAGAAMYLAFASQNPFHSLDFVSNAPLQEALDRLQNMQLARPK
jgi:hypothetical protein